MQRRFTAPGNASQFREIRMSPFTETRPGLEGGFRHDHPASALHSTDAAGDWAVSGPITGASESMETGLVALLFDD